MCLRTCLHTFLHTCLRTRVCTGLYTGLYTWCLHTKSIPLSDRKPVRNTRAHVCAAHSHPRARSGTSSASRTACLWRGHGRTGTQNDRLEATLCTFAHVRSCEYRHVYRHEVRQACTHEIKVRANPLPTVSFPSSRSSLPDVDVRACLHPCL